MELRVETDSQADPVVVWFGCRRLEVLEVVDRWYAPAMRWWKVQTADGPYILRRAFPDGDWELAAVPRQ